MEEPDNQFARALAEHHGRQLKEAFDYCNRHPDLRRYDRTALARWLSGTIPSRGDFVAELAARLDDLRIFEAWVSARSANSSSDVKAVVTRFKHLAPADKSKAYRQIRDDMVATSPSVRSQFSIRIDLSDSDDPDLFDCYTSVDWWGHVPAEAKIILATDEADQEEILERPDCIFREIMPLEKPVFTSAIARFQHVRPSLSYMQERKGRGHRRQVSFQATELLPGYHVFDNEEIDRAHVKLRLRYPYPRSTNSYPVVFSSYEVSGPASVTLVLHSERTHSPRALAFLGLGRRWATSELPGRELVVDAGTPDGVFSAGTGILLHWSEWPISG